jgi:hypothetical protein
MTLVWSFKTKQYHVALYVEQEQHYRYDGCDDDGSVQRALDRGEYVAFDSTVIVERNGTEIARDSLGGSVYEFGNVHEFWTAHRGDAGGHYFPDMVRSAIRQARKEYAKAS